MVCWRGDLSLGNVGLHCSTEGLIAVLSIGVPQSEGPRSYTLRQAGALTTILLLTLIGTITHSAQFHCSSSYVQYNEKTLLAVGFVSYLKFTYV
jgi:hypothetical protein